MMLLPNSMRLLSLLPRPSASALSLCWSSSTTTGVNMTPPKRPCVAAHTTFTQDRFSAVKASLPGAKTVDVMRELHRQWKQLSDVERRPFEARAEENRKVYKEEMEKFTETLKQANLLEEYHAQKSFAAAAKRDQKARAETRSLERKLNKPKRPLTSFMLYVMEFRSSKGTSGMSTTEIIKAAASQWSSMSDSDRSPYVDRSKVLRDEYVNEKAAWEERVEGTPEMEKIKEARKTAKRN